MNHRRHTPSQPALLALTAAGALLLAGCQSDTVETDATTASDTPAATSAAPADVEVAAAEVIDAYTQTNRVRIKDGKLGESVRQIATYSYIDKRNSTLAKLEQGGRTYRLLDSKVLDHQVVEDGLAEAEPTITLNLCLESQVDYKESDGKVIFDPKKPNYGAEQVTAGYNAVEDVWQLTNFEKGEADACEFPSSSDDSATSTS